MKEVLKNSIIEIYREMLTTISSKDKLFPFAIQWGIDYPKQKNEGILFVGKSTNGWVTSSKNIDVLFGETNKKIFARHDQMSWVTDLEGDNEIYNTKKSAFWRVIKGISKDIYKVNNWYDKVAWSNLYKVGYSEGNPNENLKREQLQFCKKILEQEIEILSPKFVIFLTSGWENPFIEFLAKGQKIKIDKKVAWDKKYKSESFKLGNTIYIKSYHPQGKKEIEHRKAITKIVKSYIENQDN